MLFCMYCLSISQYRKHNNPFLFLFGGSSSDNVANRTEHTQTASLMKQILLDIMSPSSHDLDFFSSSSQIFLVLRTSYVYIFTFYFIDVISYGEEKKSLRHRHSVGVVYNGSLRCDMKKYQNSIETLNIFQGRLFFFLFVFKGISVLL